MQSHAQEPSFMMEKEADDTTNAISISHIDNAHQEPADISSSEKDDSHGTDDRYDADTGKQLVVYDPMANGAGEIQFVPQPIQCQQPSFMRRSMPSRVLPSVGAFTVQCANCFKWRLIPTKEKYEEIREHVLEKPFYCEAAREWRPDISCDDPTDISQDGSRLWAIDKPNIAQPPRGWQRLLRIRGEGSTKFADVYYVAPSGKRLRSMVEVQKYLMEHPEYSRDGVKLSQFSFQIPKPLQENYVRKRPARLTASSEPARAVKPSEVQTLAWARADDFTELQLGRPPLLPPPPTTSQDSLSDRVERPPKKRRTPTRDMYSSDPVSDQSQLKVEEQNQLRNGDCGL